jgi:hypothetical protein
VPAAVLRRRCGKRRLRRRDPVPSTNIVCYNTARLFDGGRRVNDVLNSPIFSNGFTTPSIMGGDATQVGDAFVRAQWNKIGSGYHVRLVNDAVKPVTLDVPASKGIAYQRPVGAWRESHGLGATDTISGVADVNWFSTHFQSLIGSLKISATTVPIFLTDNVLLYIGHENYPNCCILGYHGAGMPVGHGAGSANGNGKQPVQTFIYGAWTTPGTYSGFLQDYTNPTRTAPNPVRGLADIHALSHEVSEWLDDPYVNSVVQPWLTPTAPQYGCTGVLETGDPVVGVWFPYSGNPVGSEDGYNYYGQSPRGRGQRPVVRPRWHRACSRFRLQQVLDVHGPADDRARRPVRGLRLVRARLLVRLPLTRGRPGDRAGPSLFPTPGGCS